MKYHNPLNLWSRLKLGTAVTTTTTTATTPLTVASTTMTTTTTLTYNSPLRNVSEELYAADLLLRETMPSYKLVGNYLLELLKVEINSSDKYSELLRSHGFIDGKQLEVSYLMQFLNYTRKSYPFNLYASLTPRQYWKKLKQHSESVLLAVSINFDVDLLEMDILCRS